MKKNKMAVLLCGSMMVLGFSGCGGNKAETTTQGKVEAESKAESKVESKTEDKASSKEAPKADATKKVSLTFSNLFVEGESFHEVIVPAVEKFNADHKDAEIIIEEMPQEAYLTQTNARGTADDLAELVMVNGTMMKAFSDIGVIIPLTEMVEEMKLEDIMREGIFRECMNLDDGEIYSLPIALGTYGFILYNTDIFNQAGVKEFPKTLDEFSDACEKIKKAGYTPMGLGLKDLWAGDSILFSSFVNNFVGNEWYDNIRQHNGKAKFTDAEFINALKAYQDIAAKGDFNSDFVSISNDERCGLYMNKKVAMISAGDWECNNVLEGSPEVAKVTKVGLWPAPKDSKVQNSIVQSSAWGIALGSRITDEQKKVAMEFLKDYFFSDVSGKTMIEGNNEFVSWNVEYDESKLSPLTVGVQKQVANGTPCLNWDSTLDPTVKEIFHRGTQELLMQSISAEDLAQNMQDEYETLGE